MSKREDLIERLTESLSSTLLSDREKTDLISAILTGQPVLIVGPRGTSKEMIAARVLEVIGLDFVTVNCSANLRREDLFGDVDPLVLRRYGYSDERSYISGMIQKADDGVLFLKDLDNMQHKLAEALADFMDDGIVTVGQRDVKVDLKIIALATSFDVDERLLDRFQVVRISYPENREKEKRFIASTSSSRTPIPDYIPELASRFLARSRKHPDLESGASTRSGIRFVENVCACKELSGREPDEEDLYNSCFASFAHSIKVNPFSWKTNRELAKNIFQDAVISTQSADQEQAGKQGHLIGRYRIPIIAALLILLIGVGSFMAMSNRGPPNIVVPHPNTSSEFENTVSPFLGNVTEEAQEVQVPSETLAQITDTIGPVLGEGNVTTLFDDRTDRLFISDGNQTWVCTNYTDYLIGGEGIEDPGAGGTTGEDGKPPSIFRDFSPILLIFSFMAIAFLSTFLFDYLGVGGWIRNSKLMAGLRKKFGISWEPLTSLYRNISEEVSPLSQRLEGEALGETVKEISAARDELYAEKAEDRASLADIADLAKKRPDRYPALSSLLGKSKKSDSSLPPENQLIEDLKRHLVREGLISGSKDVSFTHRVSKFLVSDVDERILRRVYDALRGVVQEELPPLPSSDIKDFRKYQRGDSYKDIAIRETIRDAIKAGRMAAGPGNLFVYEREPEKRELVVKGEADIVVVLDLSGSMAYGDKLWYAKQAIVVMTIIAERYGNRVGVVGFRDLSTEIAELGVEKNITIAKVANLLPRGGTNIAAGVRRSIDLLIGEVDVRKGNLPDPHIQPERRKQVILLTDGDATHPKPKQFAAEYARRCARLASRYGIIISVVCIGTQDDSSEAGRSYNPELAEQIAKIGGGRIFFVKDMRDLSSVFVSEIDELMMKTDLAQIPIPKSS